MSNLTIQLCLLYMTKKSSQPRFARNNSFDNKNTHGTKPKKRAKVIPAKSIVHLSVPSYMFYILYIHKSIYICSDCLYYCGTSAHTGMRRWYRLGSSCGLLARAHPTLCSGLGGKIINLSLSNSMVFYCMYRLNIWICMSETMCAFCVRSISEENFVEGAPQGFQVIVNYSACLLFVNAVKVGVRQGT